MSSTAGPGLVYIQTDMNRRTFALTSAGAAASLPGAAAASRKGIVQLGFFRLRNSADGQAARVSDYLKNTVLPALQRNGIGPVGFFRNLMGGGEGPFVMALTAFPSLAGIDAAQ